MTGRRTAIVQATRRTPTRSSSWLSLGPASRLVGVDTDTLRRWANAGRITVFTTPGGHRRFERGELERLLESTESRARPSLGRLGATPGRLSAAMRRSYATAGRQSPNSGEGVQSLDRDDFRKQGRLLVAALLARLDALDADAATAAEEEATAIAAGLGARLAQADVALAEAVSLFIASRQPFVTELASIGHARRLTVDRATELLEDASSLLDRMLLAFIASHEATSGGRA